MDVGDLDDLQHSSTVEVFERHLPPMNLNPPAIHRQRVQPGDPTAHGVPQCLAPAMLLAPFRRFQNRLTARATIRQFVFLRVLPPFAFSSTQSSTARRKSLPSRGVTAAVGRLDPLTIRRLGRFDIPFDS
jgi:hypothetical protein